MVSRASPARVVQASVGPGQPVGAHRQVVVGAEEGVEAELLRGLRDGEQVVVGGALLGLGEDAQLHTPDASQPAGVPPGRATPGGVLLGRTGQDDSETINSEVMLVFRKKSRGQIIGAELQEGFTHIGTAMSEAGRLAAEQLGPRVEAAREAATPAYEAAQKAVAPKVAAAVAAAAPAIASAREGVASAREGVATARDTLAPRVEAARDAAAPRVAAAVLAAPEGGTRPRAARQEPLPRRP